MHVWVELQGAWFLEVAQHQLVHMLINVKILVLLWALKLSELGVIL